jgi:3-oxoadipate enol-lactonase
MPKIHVKSTEYYYEIHGRGHPLVLISGFAGDHTSWNPIKEALARHFQVIAIDNRGSGQTIDKGEELSAELMADDMAELIHLLHLKKPHVMGQSMGGAIAQSLASRYGDRIGKLILLMTTAKWRKAVLLSLASQIQMIEKKMPFEEIFPIMISWIYGESFLRNHKKIEELKKDMAAKQNPQSLENKKRQFKVLEKFNGIQDLHKISSKTLVIYGKEDIAVLPECAKSTASLIPHVEIIGCACGHGIMREMPEQLSEIVIQFLSA